MKHRKAMDPADVDFSTSFTSTSTTIEDRSTPANVVKGQNTLPNSPSLISVDPSIDSSTSNDYTDDYYPPAQHDQLDSPPPSPPISRTFGNLQTTVPNSSKIPTTDDFSFKSLLRDRRPPSRATSYRSRKSAREIEEEESRFEGAVRRRSHYGSSEDDESNNSDDSDDDEMYKARNDEDEDEDELDEFRRYSVRQSTIYTSVKSMKSARSLGKSLKSVKSMKSRRSTKTVQSSKRSVAYHPVLTSETNLNITDEDRHYFNTSLVW